MSESDPRRCDAVLDRLVATRISMIWLMLAEAGADILRRFSAVVFASAHHGEAEHHLPADDARLGLARCNAPEQL